MTVQELITALQSVVSENPDRATYTVLREDDCRIFNLREIRLVDDRAREIELE